MNHSAIHLFISIYRGLDWGTFVRDIIVCRKENARLVDAVSAVYSKREAPEDIQWYLQIATLNIHKTPI